MNYTLTYTLKCACALAATVVMMSASIEFVLLSCMHISYMHTYMNYTLTCTLKYARAFHIYICYVCILNDLYTQLYPQVCMHTCSNGCDDISYGVASVSRIDKIIGLFCKRDLPKRLYSAEETYNFIDPTDRSYPIAANSSYPTHTICIPSIYV